MCVVAGAVLAASLFSLYLISGVPSFLVGDEAEAGFEEVAEVAGLAVAAAVAGLAAAVVVAGFFDFAGVV